MEVSNNLIKELERYEDEEDTSIWANCDIKGYEDFHKNSRDSQIWWTNKIDSVGELNISFDRKKIYNLFEDYPYNMSQEEIKIFEEEEHYWASFFAWRKK